MQLGVFNLTQYEQSIPASEVWSSVHDLTMTIDEGGFDSLWIGEHHVTPDDQYLQNIPVLAALASETENVTIGAGAFLLPLHNPVHVAELAVTIDVMSDGRFQMACGLGYRDEEFDVFGVDKGDRVGRLVEGIQLMKRLWTEDKVSFAGDHFSVSDVTINPKPAQSPHPPLLVAGYVDAAAKRAANIGNSWMYGNLQNKAELKRQFTLYEEAVAEANREDECFTPPVLREAFVLPDGDEAFDTVRPYLQQKFESYAGWGLEGVDFDDFREASEDRFLIGSPESVLADLEEYADIGVNHVVLRVQYPGMDASTAKECLETISDEVIPHLPS
ncbi:LLM class flavin-dependent oxidoreductase [Haladaptatus halobius]|uniref:LLM class flavin-dependent oxidoreductase n=1 Tax=Haladaptatus halobius TaxID=2884875 RepID=UPI001D0A7C54|nr:LLM class flavin-dependent oxidoreductase [Haladaptatus halobius]